MKKYVKMRFNADIENVTFARGTVASFLINEDLTLNEMNEIKTIVEKEDAIIVYLTNGKYWVCEKIIESENLCKLTLKGKCDR